MVEFVELVVLVKKRRLTQRRKDAKWLPAAEMQVQSSKLKAIAFGRERSSKFKGIKDGFKFYVLGFTKENRLFFAFLAA